MNSTQYGDTLSCLAQDIRIIETRIAYLEAHPELIRTTGDWNHEPYAECTHLGLLKSELIMLRGAGETILRGVVWGFR